MYIIFKIQYKMLKFKHIHNSLYNNKIFFREEKVIFMGLENGCENSAENTDKKSPYPELSEEEKKLSLEFKEKKELQKQLKFLTDVLFDILVDFQLSKELTIEDFPNADINSPEDIAYIDLYNLKRNKIVEQIEELNRDLKKSNDKNLEFQEKTEELRYKIENLTETIRELLLKKFRLGAEIEDLRETIHTLENALGKHHITGLPSQRILEDTLTDRLENIEDKKPVKLCYMDLTDFKNVNTVIHYNNADKVLKIYGEALQEALQNLKFTDKNKKIIPYHTHGDEFALILENISNDEIVEYARAVEEIAQEKIQKLLIDLKKERDEKNKLMFPNLTEIHTSLSFGVTDLLPKDKVNTLTLRSNRLLDAVKYFKKGDIIIKNPDNTYTIYSGFENSDNGYSKQKTYEEIQELIHLSENKKQEIAENERKRRAEDKQKMEEQTREWKKDFSKYPNIPEILSKSLENNETFDDFSSELKELQRKNAELSKNTENHENIISEVETYLSRKLTASQRDMLPFIYNLPKNNSKSLLIIQKTLQSFDFTTKEVKILMRSGLLGVRE